MKPSGPGAVCSSHTELQPLRVRARLSCWLQQLAVMWGKSWAKVFVTRGWSKPYGPWYNPKPPHVSRAAWGTTRWGWLCLCSQKLPALSSFASYLLTLYPIPEALFQMKPAWTECGFLNLYFQSVACLSFFGKNNGARQLASLSKYCLNFFYFFSKYEGNHLALCTSLGHLSKCQSTDTEDLFVFKIKSISGRTPWNRDPTKMKT